MKFFCKSAKKSDDEETNKLPTNSFRFVFINSRINYSASRLGLVNVETSKENSSAVKDRSNAEEAKCILRKINYWFFCF